jgi:hypothetical protein
MTASRRFLALLAWLLAGAAPVLAQGAPEGLRWRAVMVAGDPSLPVWDNAARRLEQGLLASGRAVPGQVTRLSARPAETARGARPGGLEATLAAIQAIRPAAGEGCLIFLTMHGAPNAGLVFAPENRVLTPNLLDKVLQLGCGEAPTLVVASGCFTGDFAAGNMARPNRVVLTAARADRSSFGCGAGFELTVFDDCLLQGLAAGGAVTALRERTQECVRLEEVRQRATPPSEPNAHLGAALRGLVLAPMPSGAPARQAPPTPPTPRKGA